MSRDRFAWGVASTLLGAIAWGFSGACFQFLFAGYAASPLMLCTIRMLGASVVFLLATEIRSPGLIARMLRDHWTLARLPVFGVAGLLGNQLFYTTTITYTNAGTATVLQTLNAAVILAWVCLRNARRPSVPELVALACALAGTYLIATGGNPRALSIPPEGLFFGLGTAVVAAFYISYPRQLFERWGSFAVTGLGMLAGGIVALAALVISGEAATGLPPLDANGVLALVVIVLVGSFGAYALYLHGVSIVGSVDGSMLGAIEPVSATAFSALWLGTAFGWADWAALALMVACVLLIARQEGAQDAAAE